MDAWIDGLMDEWINGCMDEWMHKWMFFLCSGTSWFIIIE